MANREEDVFFAGISQEGGAVRRGKRADKARGGPGPAAGGRGGEGAV